MALSWLLPLTVLIGPSALITMTAMATMSAVHEHMQERTGQQKQIGYGNETMRLVFLLQQHDGKGRKAEGHEEGPR